MTDAPSSNNRPEPPKRPAPPPPPPRDLEFSVAIKEAGDPRKDDLKKG